MGELVRLNPGPVAHSARQLTLIHDTIAKGLTSPEFDLFMTVAQHTGLDPFRKQIYPLVFNADDQKKRRVVYITSIDGLRAIAFRSQRYRPDEDEPDFTYDPDLKGPENPLGITRARVRIYVKDVGAEDWRPVSGVAYWDEFAPILEDGADGFEWVETGEVWADSGKPKRRKQPKGDIVRKVDDKGNWARMPRLMLAKCAEAQALRKAFPEDLSSLYEASEFDRSRVVDLSPSEYVEVQRTEDRLERVGFKGASIMFQLTPASPLEQVALGQVADKVLEVYRDFDLNAARWFDGVNRVALQEFWARSPGDALALKKEMEALRARKEAEAHSETQTGARA